MFIDSASTASVIYSPYWRAPLLEALSLPIPPLSVPQRSAVPRSKFVDGLRVTTPATMEVAESGRLLSGVAS